MTSLSLPIDASSPICHYCGDAHLAQECTIDVSGIPLGTIAEARLAIAQTIQKHVSDDTASPWAPHLKYHRLPTFILSKELYRRVLDRDLPWVARAFFCRHIKRKEKTNINLRFSGTQPSLSTVLLMLDDVPLIRQFPELIKYNLRDAAFFAALYGSLGALRFCVELHTTQQDRYGVAEEGPKGDRIRETRAAERKEITVFCTKYRRFALPTLVQAGYDIKEELAAFPWPPTESQGGPGEGGDTQSSALFLEALAKTIAFVCDELTAGHYDSAKQTMQKIRPAMLRKGLTTIPPHRADLMAMLTFCEDSVIDPLWYVKSLRLAEDCYTVHTERDIFHVFGSSQQHTSTGFFPQLVGLFDEKCDRFPFKAYSTPQVNSLSLKLHLFPPPLDTPFQPLAPLFGPRAEFLQNLEAFLGFHPEEVELGALGYVVAGGAIVQCLLPQRLGLPPTATVAERVAYFDIQCPDSDIDIFPIRLLPLKDGRRMMPDAMKDSFSKVKRLIDQIQKASKGVEMLVLSRTYTITIVRPHPARRIQIHLGQWASVLDVLLNADVDCCAVGFDGLDCWMTQRGHYAWLRRCNIVNGETLYRIRGSPVYEQRLLKYAKLGFAIVDLGLSDPALVDAAVPASAGEAKSELLGLSGLLWLRTVERYPEILQKKRSVKAGSELPGGPGVTLQDIADAVLAKGYVPSDNYGTHESGYIVCYGWCGTLKYEGTTDRWVYPDDVEDNQEDLDPSDVREGGIAMSLEAWGEMLSRNELPRAQFTEGQRFRVPSWYKGIPGLDPGDTGYDDEYD